MNTFDLVLVIQLKHLNSTVNEYIQSDQQFGTNQGELVVQLMMKSLSERTVLLIMDGFDDIREEAIGRNCVFKK